MTKMFNEESDKGANRERILLQKKKRILGKEITKVKGEVHQPSERQTVSHSCERQKKKAKLTRDMRETQRFSEACAWRRTGFREI